jgi:hypothetical protein
MESCVINLWQCGIDLTHAGVDSSQFNQHYPSTRLHPHGRSSCLLPDASDVTQRRGAPEIIAMEDSVLCLC